MLGLCNCFAFIIFIHTRFTFGQRNEGYLITAPNRFIPGYPETVCIDIYKSSGGPEVVKLKLLEIWWSSDSAVSRNVYVANSTVTVQPADGTICTNLTYPKQNNLLRLPDQVRLDVSGSGAFVFNDSKQIAILPSIYDQELTFIQTDKPVYRAGQLVQFRVITMDIELKPLTTLVSSIYLETPSKVKIDQWRNISILLGLSQLSFQLSAEPEFGLYTIILEKNGKKEAATFQVEKYVLPKYEVTLKPPDYVTFNTEQIEVKICAKYTYGLPVQGTAEGSVCVRQSGATPQTSRCVTINHRLKDGCHATNISAIDLGLKNYNGSVWDTHLDILAKVREQGSGVYSESKHVTLPVQLYNFSITFVSRDRFKPGLSYKGRIFVRSLEGYAIDGEPVEIRIRSQDTHISYNKTFISNGIGIIKFSIPTATAELSSFSIQAQSLRKFFDVEGPVAWLTVKAWYSPSGSFLQIEPDHWAFSCEIMHTFRIMYTTSLNFSTTLQYKVVGAGNIVASGSKPVEIAPYDIFELQDTDGWDNSTVETPCLYFWEACSPVIAQNTIRSPVAAHKGYLLLSLKIRPKISTTWKLLIYYVRPDNEVVADNIGFSVQPCTPNHVQMRFSKTETMAGDRIGLTFKASPSSICSYRVVDKSVFRQRGDKQLALEDTLGKLQEFALTENTGIWEDPNARCMIMQNDNTEFRRTTAAAGSIESFYYTLKYQDASNSFRSSGLMTMTNLQLYTSPCERHEHKTGWRLSPPGIKELEGRPGRQDIEGILPPIFYLVQESFMYKTIHTYFPETWLWDLFIVDKDGNFEMEKEVPDKITEWIGNAVCLHPYDGLGLSATAALTVSKHFSVSMNLPYSVIRHEYMPVAITVFNYLSQCLAVKISVNKTSEYSIVGSSAVTKCVCSQQSVTATFTLIMLSLGNINVSMTTEVVSTGLACPFQIIVISLTGTKHTEIQSVLVKPEGIPRAYTVSDLICLSSSNGETQGISVTNYSLPLPNSSVLIDESDIFYVNVVGDVMGPTLSNVGNLLSMPYGCAEQTMITFSPNIFVLRYLKAINREQKYLKNKAIEYMKQGYQKIITFAHPDQSYSAFGQSSGAVGSMWLTAFVVKCLGLAQPYIFIDQNIQTKSISYLKSKQNQNGCFPMLGFVIHKEMHGVPAAENKAAITAFVAIAMIRAGVNKEDQSLVKAFSCIDGQTYTDGYTTAIVAYAYSLYEPTSLKALTVYRKLNKMMKSGNGLSYWKANDNSSVPSGASYYPPKARDIETSAYALMTVINMEATSGEKINKGLPIAKWLSTQRNDLGGFSSTQDTLIGIEAITSFAELTYNSGISANVTVSELASNSQVTSFSVNSGNSLVELTKKIPRVKDLVLRASGAGCFLFQANVKYSVNAPDTDRQSFVTTAEVFRRQNATNGCTMKSIRICTRYFGVGGISNMVIVQVHMVSGWHVERSSLDKLKTDPGVKLRRYEIENEGTTQLYFTELTRTLKCFSINIEQVHNVLNAKPAAVTTYDYYSPELRHEVQYIISNC